MTGTTHTHAVAIRAGLVTIEHVIETEDDAHRAIVTAPLELLRRAIDAVEAERDDRQRELDL